MPLERQRFESLPEYPEVYGRILATGNLAPISADAHTGDTEGGGERVHFHPLIRVPDFDALVPGAADDALPISADPHAHDRAGVSFQAKRLNPAVSIPDLYRLVTAAADDAL